MNDWLDSLSICENCGRPFHVWNLSRKQQEEDARFCTLCSDEYLTRTCRTPKELCDIKRVILKAKRYIKGTLHTYQDKRILEELKKQKHGAGKIINNCRNELIAANMGIEIEIPLLEITREQSKQIANKNFKMLQ